MGLKRAEYGAWPLCSIADSYDTLSQYHKMDVHIVVSQLDYDITVPFGFATRVTRLYHWPKMFVGECWVTFIKWLLSMFS